MHPPAIYDRVKSEFYVVTACYACRSYDLVKGESIFLTERSSLHVVLFTHPYTEEFCLELRDKVLKNVTVTKIPERPVYFRFKSSMEANLRRKVCLENSETSSGFRQRFARVVT